MKEFKIIPESVKKWFAEQRNKLLLGKNYTAIGGGLTDKTVVGNNVIVVEPDADGKINITGNSLFGKNKVKNKK